MVLPSEAEIRELSPEERIRQHRGVIDAAKQAGVSHIVNTSFIDTADDSPFFAWTVNKDTEAHLKESKLTYTILRNGGFKARFLNDKVAVIDNKLYCCFK